MKSGWLFSLMAVPVFAAAPVEILVLYDNTTADQRTAESRRGREALQRAGEKNLALQRKLGFANCAARFSLHRRNSFLRLITAVYFVPS